MCPTRAVPAPFRSTAARAAVFGLLTALIASTLPSCAHEHIRPLEQDVAPSVVSDLQAGRDSRSSVALRWTAPGEHGAVGAVAYDLRFSMSPITERTWAEAIRVGHGRVPAAAGQTDTMTVRGLVAGPTYFFGLKAATPDSLWSGLSNVCFYPATPPGPPRCSARLLGDGTDAVVFDPSPTEDPWDPDSLIQVRWDFEGDGNWEVDWDADARADQLKRWVPPGPGQYFPTLSVRNSYLPDSVSTARLSLIIRTPPALPGDRIGQ